MSWSEHRLDEVADFHLGKMLDQAKNRGEMRPYLANVNVRWGAFDLADLREMRFTDSEMERYSVKRGDILLCEGGEPGRCALWNSDQTGMMFQKALHRIRPHPCLDSTFLFYSLLNLKQTNGFEPLVTGAAIKHLPREQLAKLKVRFPKLRIQRSIASVLEAYDDLIATNQRRITLLEDTARRLYREWFVHLRFPGHELVPMKGGLPAGWQRVLLGSICDSVPGATVQTGPFGSQLHRHDYTESGIPVVMPQDIVGDRIRIDRIAYVNEQTAGRLSRHRLKPLDIVFPRRGDIGKRALIEEHQDGFLCGTGCLKISLPLEPLHPMLLYYQLADPDMVQFIEGKAVGATMLNLSAGIFRMVECLVPSVQVQTCFVEKVVGFRQQVDILEKQNAHLAKARALLLPRLMSGQLDVSGIQLPEEVA